jgi:hypothetical protein
LFAARVVESARQAGGRSENPERCGAERYEEGQTGDAARSGAIAPTLEHGCESNEEEDDREYPETFEPHGCYS